MRAFLLPALLFCAAPLHAQFHSPTLEELELLASADPAAAPTGEAAKVASAQRFTGEPSRAETAVVPGSTVVEEAPAEPKAADAPKPGAGNSYVFKGKSPIKGINIYTPELDPTGGGSTDEPAAPEGPIKPWMTYGAIGLGAGLAIAGIWFPPLLFLGGLLLGAGGALWFVNKKLTGE